MAATVDALFDALSPAPTPALKDTPRDAAS